MSMQFYSHLNFSVLTVDWASPLSVKRSWGRVWCCTRHFREMSQLSAMAADDSGAVIVKWLLN
jgi:hypothetical protein